MQHQPSYSTLTPQSEQKIDQLEFEKKLVLESVQKAYESVICTLKEAQQKDPDVDLYDAIGTVDHFLGPDGELQSWITADYDKEIDSAVDHMKETVSVFL